jgi:Flp pilus assembly protein TadG
MLSRLLRRSRPRALPRILSHEGGIAAVEFSLILPILVVLWIGGVEVTSALSVDRRLDNLASSIGDLVARSKVVTWADVDQIFTIAPGALYPYCKTSAECTTASLSMRVTGVDMDGSGNAKSKWSRASGSVTAYADNTALNTTIAASLRVPNSQIIMSEVYLTYRPAVGYMITGNLNLNDRMFFVPRLVQYIKLCQSVNPDTNCKS